MTVGGVGFSINELLSVSVVRVFGIYTGSLGQQLEMSCPIY